MLYVKGNLETIALDYDNVYAKCPDCGKLHKIDLAETLDIAEDVHTSVFCEKCTKQREEEGKEEERLMCEYCEKCLPDEYGINVCAKTGTVVSVGTKKTEGYFWCKGEEFKEMED